MIIVKQNNPLADFFLVFDYGMQYLPILYNFRQYSLKKQFYTFLGADASSGYKNFNYIPNLDATLREERKKQTKTLFSTQVSLVKLLAILPDGTVIVLWENKNVTSILGHQPWRHAFEPEDKM